MGCCMSTNNHSSSSNGRECAPPPSMEEETVKEVLSETPALKLKPSLLAIPKLKQQDEKMLTTTPSKPAISKIEKKPPACVVAEEISEVSEICSASECVSTTTVAESRDDGEVKQRVDVDVSPAKFPRNRTYSGDLTGKRDRLVVDRSPARRSDPSPGRRNDVGMRLGFGRENQTRRRLAANVYRRDSGESSCRRSMSPASRTDGGGGGCRPGMGRSPSNGKTGHSPGRVRAAPLEKNSKVDYTSKEGKWGPSNESIENPLVSLECFIFL